MEVPVFTFKGGPRHGSEAEILILIVLYCDIKSLFKYLIMLYVSAVNVDNIIR